MTNLISVVSATRYSRFDFWNKSALGQSLGRFADDPRIQYQIAYDNLRGLPEIYNQAIRSDESTEIILFVHDDVWLDDIFWIERVINACANYDVVGLAGNTRRTPSQPAWCFVWGEEEGIFRLDTKEHLSGAIAHGNIPGGAITRLGPSGEPCELLDGVFIAARKDALLESGVSYDERFKFHFYDLDFCRQTRSKGLTVGTWPISITHQSEGAFGSTPWWSAYRAYIEKWGD